MSQGILLSRPYTTGGTPFIIGEPGIRLPTEDFFLEVSKRHVPGYSAVHKYGKNPDIDNAATYQAIWNGGGAYTGFDATAAETLEVFSSDAADAGTLVSSGTATGGTISTLIDTGATFVSDGVAAGDVVINDTGLAHGVVESVTETVITVYQFTNDIAFEINHAYRVATQASTGAPVCLLGFLLDANYDQSSEYIILNGITAVDTVGTYLRQSRARTTGGDNAGTITSRQKTTTANIFMVMPINYNSTMISAYTIPRGFTGFAVNWFIGLAGKVNANISGRLRRRNRGCVFQVQEELALMSTGSTFVDRGYKMPKNSFPQMSDVFVEASSNSANTQVIAGFDLLIISNDLINEGK